MCHWHVLKVKKNDLEQYEVSFPPVIGVNTLLLGHYICEFWLNNTAKYKGIVI